MPHPRIREAVESSSAAVLQAVAGALSDAWFQTQRSSPAQARLGRVAARLPDRAVCALVAAAVRGSGLNPALAPHVHTEGLARQAIGVYDHVDNGVGYPAMFIGAPNGGVAYLAALLRAPFLPSHFVLSFAHSGDPDDVDAYQAAGARLIQPILRRNPDLVAINHYDPLHDRFLIEHVCHVRLKLLDLPEAYRNFIRAHLAPGGVIFYTDCAYEWDQFAIGERHFFQVGGLGGFTAAEYLDGSPAIEAWRRQQAGLRQQAGRNAAPPLPHPGGWRLQGQHPLQTQRESEWGSLPEFRQAARRFAAAESYAFSAITGEHPEDFSALAYTAYLWEARLHERQPQGLLVETFSQLNPTAALRSDLLPLWLPFNTTDSLEFLARMIRLAPKQLPVLLSLLANFTVTPDVPLAEAWRQIAAQAGPVTWIGTHARRYPIDLASRFDYLPDLQTWTRLHPGQEPGQRPQLSPDDLQQMVRYLAQEGPRLYEYLLAPGAEPGT